jgi:hypothetical protein
VCDKLGASSHGSGARAARAHLALAAASILGLLGGLWAGLVRIGWPLPPVQPLLPMAHGPLMVSGFLGTLIGLERAVALRTGWAYLAPVLTGTGGLVVLGGFPGPSGPLLIAFGSAGLAAVFGVICARQPALFTATMALGALAWLTANAAWLAAAPMPVVVPWFTAFLVLTIVGERLELSRMTRLARSSVAAFLAAVGVYVAGLVLSTLLVGLGRRLSGVGIVALAVWLLRYDVARRTVRQMGLPRFIAISLLSGYLWLGVGGVLWVLFGDAQAGVRYDAMLHAVFLGFVFAMVFAHAPVILPAVLGRAIQYRPAFYAHVGLLDLSLVVRLVGDLAGWPAVREWGGLLGAAAILLFLATSARALRQGHSRRVPQRTPWPVG